MIEKGQKVSYKTNESKVLRQLEKLSFIFVLFKILV